MLGEGWMLTKKLNLAILCMCLSQRRSLYINGIVSSCLSYFCFGVSFCYLNWIVLFVQVGAFNSRLDVMRFSHNGRLYGTYNWWYPIHLNILWLVASFGIILHLLIFIQKYFDYKIYFLCDGLIHKLIRKSLVL